MCTLRNPRWIAAAKRANGIFVFEFSTSLCWLGLLFFALRNFFSSFPTSLSLDDSGVNETKKSFIFKRRSLFKDFDLCYATHTVFMFEISLVTWECFVCQRSAYILLTERRLNSSCAGKKNYNFWVKWVAWTAVTAAFRSRESERGRWRNWIYFLLFSLHFHFSSEWRTIVYLACKSILKGFFCDEHTTCVAMGALSTTLL